MNKILSHVRDFMSVPKDPELLRAQYKAFSKQMPLMYSILIANTWALSSNFIGIAPDGLTIYSPAGFTVVCVFRMIGWWRMIGTTPSDEAAYKAMSRTNNIAGIIAVLFAFWSIALFPYGSAYAQAHVAFYMAITVIGVIFCMMHLRPAAFTVALIVNVVFVGFFGLSGIPSLVATAVNVFLVSIAMLVILMVYYRDFTETVAAKAENQRLANADALTGLPNGRHFFSRLHTDFARSRLSSARVVVGILDLDGFKPVNDLYGHSMGDELLVIVGRRLEDVCKEKAYVARLGGDEFAIIASAMSDEDILALGQAICESLKQPCRIKGVTVEVAGTVGFAGALANELESETELFDRADYALYQGKRKERGSVVIFSAEHEEQIKQAIVIEKALRAADLETELSVRFQPIVEMQSGETVGFEALARWSSPTVGDVSPAVFIPVAERSGFVHRLTEVLLTKALVVAVEWPARIRLSFNLSARDISDRNCATWLAKIVEDSGFDPGRIDFEITETSMMHDFDQALETIVALKALGCGISLDDFGTGYSSLSQLHSLPLTKIKIDRSFVTDLHRKPARYKIVQSMISLSREMGLGCIVEGVETTEEAETLERLGCSLVQGYRFYRPMTSEAAKELVC